MSAEEHLGRTDGPVSVLMVTEGTYPYVMGGVSTCCHQLTGALADVDFTVLPLVSPTHPRRPLFALHPNTSLLAPIVVWDERARTMRRPANAPGWWVPATLARGLVGWRGDLDAALDALVWCREHPHEVSEGFACRRGWEHWHEALEELTDEDDSEGGRLPRFDRHSAGELYRMLRWLARVAAVPTPAVDVVHVTAAGWATIPGAVHKAIHGTPLVLTEHGVYLREAYMAAVGADVDPTARAIATRVARGLTRLAYRSADVVAPVTAYNTAWEHALGVEPERLLPLVNGIPVSDGDPTPAPGRRIVTSVGRIDPLKDVLTMLRVAAEVHRMVPDLTFVHRGPVAPGQDRYAKACRDLHRDLGLGDAFRFDGPTSDPRGAVRAADVVLLTSVSEGLPMAALEAMSEARPVVATAVGGVPDLVGGVGMVAPPGAVHTLAGSVALLLRNPGVAAELGLRGRERVRTSYRADAQNEGYRDLFTRLAHRAPEPVA